MVYFLAFAVVIGIAVGQILFKKVGVILSNTNSIESIISNKEFIIVLGSSLLLYAVATVLWILVLRELPLSKAYPFMALSFVFVPVFSKFYFGEAVTVYQIIGSVLIVAGMILSVAK